MPEEAWTPKRVLDLLAEVSLIGAHLRGLKRAEERVGDILEKALAKDSTNYDEGVKEGHRQAQAGME